MGPASMPGRAWIGYHGREGGRQPWTSFYFAASLHIDMQSPKGGTAGVRAPHVRAVPSESKQADVANLRWRRRRARTIAPDRGLVKPRRHGGTERKRAIQETLSCPISLGRSLVGGRDECAFTDKGASVSPCLRGFLQFLW